MGHPGARAVSQCPSRALPRLLQGQGPPQTRSRAAGGNDAPFGVEFNGPAIPL